MTSHASTQSIGYILSQKDDKGNDHHIAYAGKNLSQSERNYSINELELLALVSGVIFFHNYLINNKFTVYTDHKALTWLKTIKHTNSRLIRWALRLQEYTFDIIHKPGKSNNAADALSRRHYSPEQNDSSLKQNHTNSTTTNNFNTKKLTEVVFTYDTLDPKDLSQPIHLIDTKDEILTESSKTCIADTIAKDQEECPYFKDLFRYLYDGSLPQNHGRANSVPYEASQYEIW